MGGRGTWTVFYAPMVGGGKGEGSHRSKGMTSIALKPLGAPHQLPRLGGKTKETQ